MRNQYLLLFAIIFFFVNCSNLNPQKEVSLKDYYFPYQTFTTQHSYLYQNLNNSEEKHEWQMQMKREGKKTLFVTTILDGNQQKIERLEELMGSEAAKLLTYQVFNPSPTASPASARAEVLNATIFKWNASPKQAFSWKVRYQEFQQQLDTYLEKTRYFSHFEENKKIAVFEDRFFVHIPKANYEYRYSMKSYYKKGKGLIRYIMSYPNGEIKDFTLKKISTHDNH